jgi:UDP-N-acetylmuramate dehydrogenase
VSLFPGVREQFAHITDVRLVEEVPLAPFTRFAIGGPAALFFDTAEEAAFIEGLRSAAALSIPHVVVGGGTNLVVSDRGFPGIVLRYTGAKVRRENNLLIAEAGAVLQDVVDQSITFGLRGLETMTGIPGYLGGAVYGNAGAYGHSIEEILQSVKIFDGSHTRTLENGECRFSYRESIFKHRKDWIILSATMQFESSDSSELARAATGIRVIRDAKYPPSMKCAGSIFKNLLIADLPPHVMAEIPQKLIRDRKVPSAWFLEQVGAKGIRRGDIQVADYHANLIYNDGAGTAADLVSTIRELKLRVCNRFKLELEEEVQYIGFDVQSMISGDALQTK